MPLYDYRCDKCKARFEINHSFDEKAPQCPVCKIEMTKVIKPVLSIFRGTGWGKDAR